MACARPHTAAMRGLWVVVVLLAAWAAPARADYESDPFNPIVARDAWLLISQAEKSYNIPPGLLHAMSLVETGQGIRGWVLPWPYTVGVNAPGARTYASVAEAQKGLAYYRALGFVRFNVRAAGASLANARGAEVETALAVVSPAAPVTLEPRNFARRFNNAVEAETYARRLIGFGYSNLDIGMMQVNWKVHGKHFQSVSQALEPTTNLRYAVNYLLEHRQTRDWWGSVGRYHSGTATFANRYIRNVYAMYLRIHRVNNNA